MTDNLDSTILCHELAIIERLDARDGLAVRDYLERQATSRSCAATSPPTSPPMPRTWPNWTAGGRP